MSHKLRILVVDDDPGIAKTLADILRVKGHEVKVTCDSTKALAEIDQGNLDCVLSDIKMPGINGVELYRTAKKKQPNLPIVLMTAYSSDQLVREGLASGAIAVLNKPLDIRRLLSFFSFLRRERSVIIVDDDSKFCRTLGDILQLREFAVNILTKPDDLLQKLQDRGEIVLLDMKLEQTNGLHILQQIRQKHPYLPVILVSGFRDEMASAIKKALETNAHTCLYKPLETNQLLETLTTVYHKRLGKILGQPITK